MLTYVLKARDAMDALLAANRLQRDRLVGQTGEPGAPANETDLN
jgi:hypothetical protein